MPSHWQDIKFIARYNSLLYRFHANKYYWSSWITLRKFLIAFAITIVTSNPIIQRTTTLAIILFSLVIHTYHQPYRYESSLHVKSKQLESTGIFNCFDFTRKLLSLASDFGNVISWKRHYKC